MTLIDADPVDANLKGANLVDVDLRGANLVGAVTAYHGQVGSGLFVGCVVVAVVGFVFVQQEFSFGWPAGMLMIFATVALVGCTGFALAGIAAAALLLAGLVAAVFD